MFVTVTLDTEPVICTYFSIFEKCHREVVQGSSFCEHHRDRSRYGRDLFDRSKIKGYFVRTNRNEHSTVYPDVTFIVEGKEIKAHRVILHDVSEYFEKLFLDGNTNIVLQERYKTFVDFINLVYAGEIYLTDKEDVEYLLGYLDLLEIDHN